MKKMMFIVLVVVFVAVMLLPAAQVEAGRGPKCGGPQGPCRATRMPTGYPVPILPTRTPTPVNPPWCVLVDGKQICKPARAMPTPEYSWPMK